MLIFREKEFRSLSERRQTSFWRLSFYLALFVNCSGLTSGKDNRCPLYFYIQSDKNSFLKVIKVSKTKGISFDKFDDFFGCFKFDVRKG